MNYKLTMERKTNIFFGELFSHFFLLLAVNEVWGIMPLKYKLLFSLTNLYFSEFCYIKAKKYARVKYRFKKYIIFS